MTGNLTVSTSGPTSITLQNNINGAGGLGLAAAVSQYSTDAASNDITLRSSTAGSRLFLQVGIGASAIAINSNNTVGIGTSTPGYTLDVNGTVNATTYVGTTITNLSNLGLFGSNTAVSASNTTISLSNYVYGTNTTNINWASNTAVFASNAGRFGSNTAVSASNTAYWSSNNLFPKSGGTISGSIEIAGASGNWSGGSIASKTEFLKFTTASTDFARIYAEGSANQGKLVVAIQDDLDASEAFIIRGEKNDGTTRDHLYVRNDGNIGIGTSNPSYALDVNSNARINYAAIGDPGFGATYAGFAHSSAFSTTNYALLSDSSGNTYLNCATGQKLNFRVNNADQGAWNTTGLGVGTSTPSVKLDVTGSARITSNAAASSSPLLQLQNNNSNLGFFVNLSSGSYNGLVSAGDYAILAGLNSQNSADFVLGTWSSSNAGIKISKTGNVGIGVANPAFNLDVSKTMRASNLLLGTSTDTTRIISALDNNLPNNTTQYITFGKAAATNDQAEISFAYASAGSTTNRVSIGVFGSPNHFNVLAGGNVGIGTASPSRKLEVAGDGHFGGDVYVRSSNVSVSPTSDLNKGIFLIGNGVDGASTTSYNGGLESWFGLGFRCRTDGVTRFLHNTRNGDTYMAGNVGIGISSPLYQLHVTGMIYATDDVIAFSDKRLKSHIEPVTSALDKVKQLTGYTYNKVNTHSPQKITDKYMGLIAQELEEVVPEVVCRDKDGFMSVAYGNLAALFVEAIKELSSKIDTLEARLNNA